MDLRQDVRQGEPAEIRHAEQVEVRGRVGPVGVDRNDVRVLEPGEGLGLSRAGSGDLQGHGAVGKLTLLGQEHAGKRPSAQLLDEPEAGDRLASLGEGHGRGLVGLKE